LDGGADVDFSDDGSNYTPLMAALSNKREALAGFLMDKGADINLASKKFGTTPLHIACQTGCKSSVQILLDKGVDRKTTDGQGKMPVEIARSKGFEDIIEMLMPLRLSNATNPDMATLPAHWTTDINEFPPHQKWMTIMLEPGSPIFSTLQDVLATDSGQLGKGRDVMEPGSYSGLMLKCAWRVENLNLWKRYSTELGVVKEEMASLEAQGFKCPQVRLRQEFYNATSKLPFDANNDINEKLLLHGMKPETVLTILSNGCNARFSNGNFGMGSYLAEDAGKADQYVKRDTGDDPSLEELHTRLYRKGSVKVEHPGNIYYVMLVRNIMGIAVRTRSGEANVKDMDYNQPVYGTDKKTELATVPNVSPPTHYHSLLVEMGAAVKRYREFVQFHEGRLYPEYLLAYERI
jgi:hypothetical protein